LRGKSAFLRHGYRVLTNNQNHRTKENQPSRTSQTSPEAVPPTDTQAVRYERRFSLLLRFWKLLISPSEAMRDIALAPDYIGPTFIIVLEVFVAAIAIWGTMQKFNQIGSSQYISTVWGFVSAIIAVAVVISGFIMIARWLIKSQNKARLRQCKRLGFQNSSSPYGVRLSPRPNFRDYRVSSSVLCRASAYSRHFQYRSR
jgi:hypothetical protein